jgi:hypothetical protein
LLDATHWTAQQTSEVWYRKAEYLTRGHDNSSIVENVSVPNC